MSCDVLHLEEAERAEGHDPCRGQHGEKVKVYQGASLASDCVARALLGRAVGSVACPVPLHCPACI